VVGVATPTETGLFEIKMDELQLWSKKQTGK